jgi:predicted NBD/HSP70 family sugar kinase
MTFLKEITEDELTGVAFKNMNLKKNVIRLLDLQEKSTIADLGKEFNVSTPKITSTINELIEDGLVMDYGKIESTGGRRANLFGLASDSGYFVGVEVKKYSVTLGLLDFKKNMVRVEENTDFLLENTKESLQQLISIIKNFISSLQVPREKILSIGMNLTGRINYATGYSYSYFHFDEDPLSKIIEREIGIKTYLDNDTRAMAFGEFCIGVVKNEKNVLFINLDHGIGVGIMIDGQLYYGKSGFSGEFGHIPFFDNEIICHCGKKGCLETEVSGAALIRQFQEKRRAGAGSILPLDQKSIDDITLEDIILACNQDDTLAIECVAEVGEKLGKALAMLINIFNPELVILGGILSTTNDYIRLPVKSTLNKYSLSLVSNDTQLKMSKLGSRAGVIGACLLVRNKLLSVT